MIAFLIIVLNITKQTLLAYSYLNRMIQNKCQDKINWYNIYSMTYGNLFIINDLGVE